MYCPHFATSDGITRFCMKGYFPCDCENCICPDKRLVDITTTNNTKDLKWRCLNVNWKPEYEVKGDTMIFHGIDTIDKRLAMIKAYESLKEGGKDDD